MELALSAHIHRLQPGVYGVSACCHAEEVSMHSRYLPLAGKTCDYCYIRERTGSSSCIEPNLAAALLTPVQEGLEILHK